MNDQTDPETDLAAEARHHPFVQGAVRALEERRRKAVVMLEGKAKVSPDPEVRQAVTAFLLLDEQVTFWGGKPMFRRGAK